MVPMAYGVGLLNKYITQLSLSHFSFKQTLYVSPHARNLLPENL